MSSANFRQTRAFNMIFRDVPPPERRQRSCPTRAAIDPLFVPSQSVNSRWRRWIFRVCRPIAAAPRTPFALRARPPPRATMGAVLPRRHRSKYSAASGTDPEVRDSQRFLLIWGLFEMGLMLCNKLMSVEICRVLS